MIYSVFFPIDATLEVLTSSSPQQYTTKTTGFYSVFSCNGNENSTKGIHRRLRRRL